MFENTEVIKNLCNIQTNQNHLKNTAFTVKIISRQAFDVASRQRYVRRVEGQHILLVSNGNRSVSVFTVKFSIENKGSISVKPARMYCVVLVVCMILSMIMSRAIVPIVIVSGLCSAHMVLTYIKTNV